MEAISLGWPMRPSGVCARTAFSKSDPMKPPLWVPSVSTMPGLMVLTRIFFGPSSREQHGGDDVDRGLSAGVNRAVRRCDAGKQTYKISGAELIMGTGRFIAPKTLAVRLNDGGTRELVGDQVFLNVGTHAAIPSIPGLEVL
jgi:hypothetical protein